MTVDFWPILRNTAILNWTDQKEKKHEAEEEEDREKGAQSDQKS
jgi:hypothetical protein